MTNDDEIKKTKVDERLHKEEKCDKKSKNIARR